jgi:myo-inositol-1(or 4)-monophosphatase
VKVGVIYNPCLDELFVAEKGQGAILNGKPIHVSTIPTLQKSLLVTGFAPRVVMSDKNNLDHFCNFMKACQAVRRPGSAAMDLVYTAMGRFEGFWERMLHPWDVAAGLLIVLEAGGKASKFDGSPTNIYDQEILVSNGLVHKEMLDVLQKGQV